MYFQDRLSTRLIRVARLSIVFAIDTYFQVHSDFKLKGGCAGGRVLADNELDFHCAFDFLFWGSDGIWHRTVYKTCAAFLFFFRC